jgi:PAS domain S-box-containing protein
MIWKVLLFVIPLFLVACIGATFFIQQKSEEQILPNLEYIRDSKYNSLNQENLISAFDFSNTSYTSYIINEKNEFLFPRNYTVDEEIKLLCATQQAGSKSYYKDGVHKYIAIKKNGNYCLVVEENNNEFVLFGRYVQFIFFGLIFYLIILLLFFLRLSYKKVLKPVIKVTENAENALVSRWEAIAPIDSKVLELQELGKYSGYLIELTKQRGGDNTGKIVQLKDFEEKFKTKKYEGEAMRFKLAVDSAPNIILIVDKYGYINYANKSLQSVLGIDFSGAENKKITDLWHKDDDVDMWKKNYDEVANTKKPVIFSSIGYKKGNIKFEGEIQISPIKNEDDSLSNFLVVERDVTEEKQKERIKNEFISVVSHELRTPMSVIRGYSSILAEGKLGELNEKQKEYVEKINHETGQLLELANDMLDLNKFESGKIELKFEKTNLNDFVKNIMENYVAEYAKKGLKLTMENHLTKPEVNVDLKYFARVVTNLLTNAYKYTPQGTVQIFLVNPDEHTAVVAVKDTGVGIKEEALPHLFERFYQADGVMQRKQEGSGLGLSIVKRIAEAHHGLVWVESKVGVGSTFYVAVPTV